MPRRPSQRTLKNKCDLLWSKIIRSRGYCERCEKSNNLQAAHIFSRRYAHVRHDLRNGVCLCAGCHFLAHANPVDFSLWILSLKGEETINELRIKKEHTSKPDYALAYKTLSHQAG